MIKMYKKLHWTEHSKLKMRQYGLSKNKLINLVHMPERKEKGIVPGTTALMKSNKSYSKKMPARNASDVADAGGPAHRSISASRSVQTGRKTPGEIWLMYKDVKNLRKIISAWRYPGISKPGEVIPIPDDIRQELLNSNES